MKLPNFKRLYEQDFPDESKDLIRQLAISVNSGIEILYEALNRKITLRENIACAVRDVTLRVDANGKPLNKTFFTLDRSNVTVDGCHVIKATNNTNSSIYPSSGIFISFVQTDSGVEILHVTGIANSTQTYEYTLRIVAYYQ